MVLFAQDGWSARKAKRLLLEPELGVQFNKWSQAVSTQQYTGNMGGNAFGLRYGANLHWTLASWLSLGYGYKVDELSWIFNPSQHYSGDDSWARSSKAQEKSHNLLLGLKFRRGIIFLQYILASELRFPQHFVENIQQANFQGSGYGVKLQFPLSGDLFWGVSYRQVHYDKARLSGSGQLGDIDKNSQSIILDLSFPMGLL
jgi:hypothetical protein